MALIKLKPTSPGRRAVVRVVTPDLHKGKPHAALVEKKNRTAGRNHNGHITVRHMGGGHKKNYRIVDFKRDKDGVPAKVEHLEYDPNRTAHLALLCYADGERRYIIAPKGVAVGCATGERAGSADQGGQCLAVAQHSGGFDHTLHRNVAWQGRAIVPLGRYFGAVAGARRRICAAAFAFRRNSQGARELQGDHR